MEREREIKGGGKGQTVSFFTAFHFPALIFSPQFLLLVYDRKRRMRVWSGTQKKTGEKEIFHGLKMSKCGDGDGMLWLAEHRDFRFLYHLLLPVSLFFFFFKYVLAYMVPFVWPNLTCLGMVFK